MIVIIVKLEVIARDDVVREVHGGGSLQLEQESHDNLKVIHML